MYRTPSQSWPPRFTVRIAVAVVTLWACACQEPDSSLKGAVPIKEYDSVWQECERQTISAPEGFQPRSVGKTDFNALMYRCMKERGYGDYFYGGTITTVNGKAPDRYRRAYIR